MVSYISQLLLVAFIGTSCAFSVAGSDHGRSLLSSTYQFDILIAYTQQAKAEILADPNYSSLSQWANTAISNTNLAFTNSGISATASVVHNLELNWNCNSWETPWACLDSTVYKTVGVLPTHPEMLVSAGFNGADITVLVMGDNEGSSPTTYGIVYDGTFWTNKDPLSQTMAVRWGSGNYVGGYAFVHELGHLLGCMHNNGTPSNVMTGGWGPGQFNSLLFTPAHVSFINSKLPFVVKYRTKSSGAVCDCSPGIASGGVTVDAVGCGEHTPGSNQFFCYTVGGTGCATAAPSALYPGAATKYC